jgi:hypothetical protein
MDVVMDAVVLGYVMRALPSIIDIEKCFAKFDDQSREDMTMGLLESMVACGAATHRYNEQDDADEFSATERLIRNWSHVFPGDVFNIDQSERTCVEFSSVRSRYFNADWLSAKGIGPLPDWPT